MPLEAVEWLRERDGPVFAGDCVYRLPQMTRNLPCRCTGSASPRWAWCSDRPRLTDLLAAPDRFGRSTC